MWRRCTSIYALGGYLGIDRSSRLHRNSHHWTLHWYLNWHLHGHCVNLWLHHGWLRNDSSSAVRPKTGPALVRLNNYRRKRWCNLWLLFLLLLFRCFLSTFVSLLLSLLFLLCLVLFFLILLVVGNFLFNLSACFGCLFFLDHIQFLGDLSVHKLLDHILCVHLWLFLLLKFIYLRLGRLILLFIGDGLNT